MSSKFQKLNNSIIKCSKCSRLVKFREKISKEKRKQYINEKYWGKPITGFGDINGKILFFLKSCNWIYKNKHKHQKQFYLKHL